MAVTRITLDVSWDEKTQSHPTRWDWSELIDCFPDEVDLYDSEEV